MKKMLLLTLLIVVPFAALNVAVLAQSADEEAETDRVLELLRQDVRSERKQLIAMNLTMTDDEAIKFWPVFDRYTADLSKIFDSRLAIIKEYATNYATLSEEQAADLMKRSIEAEQAVVKLRLDYLPQFQQVLPAKKTAMFYQLDRRLALLIEIQLASEIPLVTP
jgi:hypothetical protein